MDKDNENKSLTEKMNESKSNVTGTATLEKPFPSKSESKSKEVNPSDPYIDPATLRKDTVVSPEVSLSRSEAEVRENIRAKEAEIKAPGSLTLEEAQKLALGMPPEKVNEIFAQVVDTKTAKDVNGNTVPYAVAKYSEVQKAFDTFNGDIGVGRNEKREFLRTLRQYIQGIEVLMDQNKI